MGKDWTGNGKSIFTTLGASNHTEKEREINDYYATDPIAVDALLRGGRAESQDLGVLCRTRTLIRTSHRTWVRGTQYGPYRQRVWRGRNRLLADNRNVGWRYSYQSSVQVRKRVH
jgi:hypothetical protein